MEEEREKGSEIEVQKEEFQGLKLKKASTNYNLSGKINRGGGVCTPPPTWTFRPHSQLDPHQHHHRHRHRHNTSSNGNNSCCGSTSSSVGNSVSARQLGANLWEILPHLPSIGRMSQQRSQRRGLHRNKGEQMMQMQTVVEDPPDSASDDQPVSNGTFHKQIASSLMRHHRSVDRNGRALQPVSPASYGSSMEITPYNPPATPSTSSQEYRGRLGDPGCTLKTSTELLKILNRIWCLEEQHTSNMSRVKTLKTELDDARARVKELLREKQMDRQVIDDLMKQVSELKTVKKNVDQDRLQSVKQELEDERKLRKRSESMHRKLGREVYEMKSSFSKVLGDLERERRARILLEDLCDEFALGIRDYEQELRSLKYRTETEQVHREHVDSLVLHISEAWLDERVQMKLAEEIQKDRHEGENDMVLDKLRPEIESFLKARQTLDSSREIGDYPKKNLKGSRLRRQSLESFHLNEATSAPQNVDDDDGDDSIDSESRCFELNKNLGGVAYSNGAYPKDRYAPKEGKVEEKVKLDVEKTKGELKEGRSLSTLQARFEKHIARVVSSSSNGKPRKEGTQIEGIKEEDLLERRSKRFGNTNRMKAIEGLLRNNSSSNEGEGERIYPEGELAVVNDPSSRGHFLLGGLAASPVKKWEPRLASQSSEMLESSSRWPSQGSREPSLKARLLEARLEGRSSQPKGPKGSA